MIWTYNIVKYILVVFEIPLKHVEDIILKKYNEVIYADKYKSYRNYDEQKYIVINIWVLQTYRNDKCYLSDTDTAVDS